MTVMFSPTPSTTTDTGYVAWSCAPARNSGLRGPGTFEITRFTGGRVRPRICIVVGAASAATAGGMNAVASVSRSAGSALWALLRAAQQLVRAPEALGRVGLVGRDRHDHHRDAVAVRALLLLGADRHGDHRDERLVGQRVAVEQPLAHGARAERDDDVVDGEAERALERLDRVERELAEREAPVRGDRAVERRAGRARRRRLEDGGVLAADRAADPPDGARDGRPARQGVDARQ